MLRFTIRELVLLTLVVGMGVAWWLDRSRIAADAKELRVELERQVLKARSDLNVQFRRNAALAGRLYDLEKASPDEN